MTDGARDGVSVSWDAARAANLANWEDRVPLHVAGYTTEPLVNDPDYVSSVAREDLATLERFLPGSSVDGLDVCHLQCHIGTDTLSFAKAGARTVGIDFSPSALAAAEALARRVVDVARDHGRTVAEPRWIETDVLESRSAVDRELGGDRLFDLVYTSIGTIGWLADLETWASQVAALLKPGGLFYIRDGHPALYSLDEDSDHLEIAYRYFGDGSALQWDDASTYVGEGTVEHSRTYEWPHPLSEVVTVLLKNGLTILAFEEGTTLPWKFAPRMVEAEDGNYRWPDAERTLVPCTFTIVARRT